jgi:hypothetical protein
LQIVLSNDTDRVETQEYFVRCKPLQRRRRPLQFAVATAIATVLCCFPISAEAPATAEERGRFQDYLALERRREAVVARAEARVGKPFADWKQEDYASFLDDLDLRRAADLGEWSSVTGVPVFVVRKGYDFFRTNAHLLADAEMADAMSDQAVESLRSEYDRTQRKLVVRDSAGTSLPLRAAASDSIRMLEFTAQILGNADFVNDQTSLNALGPYLVPLDQLPYFKEVRDALQLLPLSLVRVLRGKALYLSTAPGTESVAIWHDVSTERSPDHIGLQVGIFHEWHDDGRDANKIIRGLARLIRETVLEERFFGIYEYPLQFPEYQKLNSERRRLFGKRRDRLPPADYGFVNEDAQADATTNFTEHLAVYLTDPAMFREVARLEQAQGHPQLMDKFRFMERLVEGTSATMERASAARIAHHDAALQREILSAYLARQAQQATVATRIQQQYGKRFQAFDESDYAKFMASLDLRLDDDLWVWSNVTGIPIVALSQRSNFFHMNAHLLADVSAAKLMSWSELTGLRSRYDRSRDRLSLFDRDGNPQALRTLPAGVIQRTESTGGRRHNEGFATGRLTLEALEPYLVPLSDLENRQELIDGLRLLPLSIVKALRGKALYPTNRSRTSWAVPWHVSTDQKVTFAGMLPGCFIEPRRDQRRAAENGQSLVERGLESRKGSSLDSLLHEIGHLIDSVVIGTDDDSLSFPYQYPEFRKLRSERDRIFGHLGVRAFEGDRGFVSRFAKANSRENFAEHFWAYLRDRDGFRRRAQAEQSAGAPELMEKFLFMQALVEQTPATERRLSAEYIVEQIDLEWKERERRASAAFEEYRVQRARRQSVVEAVEQRLGKRFSQLTTEEYRDFMGDLDLTRDDDLWTWSHITGIPLVGLTEKSTFFYCNAHLLRDTRAAVAMPREQIVALQRGYDEATGKPTLVGGDGRAMALRDLPADLLQRAVRDGEYQYAEGFAEPRTVLEALAPYLTTLDSIANREAIAEALAALPLSVVKVYRGKAIYFTGRHGRSYSVGMPISNSTYEGFAGMQPGIFVDRNRAYLTTHNLVHEIGHVLDYTVIRGKYGHFLHHYQFPEFQKLAEEKNRVFGSRDDRVPQTTYGYVSRYAMTNAQESFAEHFTYFILHNDEFIEKAQEQQESGHADLMRKYRFLEKLLQRTPPTSVQLSPAYLKSLVEGRGAGDRVGSLREAPSAPWRDVHRQLGLQRDRMATALEGARALLHERALDQGEPDWIERLKAPQAPRATGYGWLPQVIEDQPLRSAELCERSYSLEGLREGFVSEFQAAAALAERSNGGQRFSLACAVPEFERLRERLSDLDDHLAYHAEWQPAVVEFHEYFAVRNRLVPQVRQLSQHRAEGRLDEAARVESALREELAPFRCTAGLALVREAGRTVLPVRIHTDIDSEPFLALFCQAVKAAYDESDAARSRGLAVELEWTRVDPDELYAKSTLASDAAFEIGAHLQRFPPGALVMTTGAARTHAYTGRAILLGSSPVTPRTLAHEFGHLLGFDDAYLRAYHGDPQDPHGVEFVEWTGLTDDLMGNPRGGRVTGEMVETLFAAYGS